ncbi:MAG: cation:proton antiporter [Pseudomonadota bacterium]
MHLHADWINEVMVFLVAASIAVPLFQRARLGSVIGFLIAGLIVGPFGLGRFTDVVPVFEYITIKDPDSVATLAELGVMFLLFTLGLEISLERLWEMRRMVFGIGGTQVFVSALVIGVIAWAFGNGTEISIVIGLAFALSSTAIAMQTLYETHRVATRLGRLSLSVLLMQDLMVVPILLIVGILAAGFLGNVAIAVIEALGLAAIAVIIILVLGRYALRPLFLLTASAKSRDLFMAVTLLAVGGIALLTSAAGLSLALGAFLAGLLLSESEFRHQIEVDIEPFKGLLLGLFFMSVGMGIDLAAVIEKFGVLVMSVVGLFVLKAAIIAVILFAFGVRKRVTVEAALLLGQAGEFVFVIVGLALAEGLVPAETAQFFFLVASLTMIATPFVARAAERIAQRFEEHDGIGDDAKVLPDDWQDHVIIGGFGRVGRLVADVLEAENVPYIGLDRDSGAVSVGRKEGYNLYFGDAAHGEILSRAGGGKARAFIVTLDEPQAAEHMVKAARELAANAMIYARAKDAGHARRLHGLGVTGIVPEAVEGSLQLAGRLLEGLGFPDDAIFKRIATVREMADPTLR